MAESSLYERLGGAFAIAAVVDRFSDAIVENPIVGQASENPEVGSLEPLRLRGRRKEREVGVALAAQHRGVDFDTADSARLRQHDRLRLQLLRCEDAATRRSGLRFEPGKRASSDVPGTGSDFWLALRCLVSQGWMLGGATR